jgi:hypothetical protein
MSANRREWKVRTSRPGRESRNRTDGRGNPRPSAFTKNARSVAIVLGLVRPVHRDADVSRLFRGQLGQLGTDPIQMQPGDLLVQMLRQDVDLVFVLCATGEQLDLRQRLIGEGVGHHETGMAGGATQIHQPPLGQQDDALAVGENDVIDLRLDVLPAVLLHGGHFDFGVEMADVADDGLILHPRHVIVVDDADIAGGGDENIGLVRRVVHGDHPIAFHRGLQGADRVDFGDPHRRAQALERLRATLADIAVAQHHRDLAGDHHVGGALDAVHQRFAAAVEVVEFGLGDRVVDVDGGEGQPALFLHGVQAMDAGRRFLGHALDVGLDSGIPAGLAIQPLADGGE